MLNQVVLVGRIVNELVKEDNKPVNLVLAVQRSFKNTEGLYDTDFINIMLWDNIASTTYEYCKKGDIVGVKGRLQTENNRLMVICEKLTFLQQHKGEDKNES